MEVYLPADIMILSLLYHVIFSASIVILTKMGDLVFPKDDRSSNVAYVPIFLLTPGTYFVIIR